VHYINLQFHLHFADNLQNWRGFQWIFAGWNMVLKRCFVYYFYEYVNSFVSSST